MKKKLHGGGDTKMKRKNSWWMWHKMGKKSYGGVGTKMKKKSDGGGGTKMKKKLIVGVAQK